MASQTKRGTTGKSARPQTGVSIWIWIGILLVAALGVAVFFVLSQGQSRFALISGDKQVLVLLRNEKEAVYRIRFEGQQPVELESIKAMLEGQTLHVDVQPLLLVSEGQEYQLGLDGSLPAGASLRLEPGDEFDLRVTYLGQTLGGNYLYGFRIGYNRDGRPGFQDVQSDHEYEIIVQ
jgi:hypothetical protein